MNLSDEQKILKDRIESAMKLIEEAMDKAGVVDFFYCGKTLDGLAIRNCDVGANQQGFSNMERYHAMLGLIEETKDTMKEVYKEANQIKDENGGQDL